MTELRKDCFWQISCKDGQMYARNAAGVCIPYENESLCHGDVVEFGENGKIRKLHDGKDSSALIYLTNQCNSNCIMCPDSVKLRTMENTVTVDSVLEYISLLPTDLEHIDITGGEPTLLKQALPDVIRRAGEQAEQAELLMLSNGRSFASQKYAACFGEFAEKKLRIEIPIHSANPQKHDFIAGCTGSFAQTKAGIHNLLANKVEVGIRIVVSKLNYRELDAVIELVHTEFPQIRLVHIMGMEMLGNAWHNREKVWVEFDEAQPYLQRAVQTCFACGIDPGLYNFPLCLFESRYWYCYKNSISGYKIRYQEECKKCQEQGRCGGFFFSTIHQTTYKVRVQV